MVLIGSEGVVQPENGKVASRSRSGSAARYIEATDNTPKEAVAS